MGPSTRRRNAPRTQKERRQSRGEEERRERTSETVQSRRDGIDDGVEKRELRLTTTNTFWCFYTRIRRCRKRTETIFSTRCVKSGRENERGSFRARGVIKWLLQARARIVKTDDAKTEVLPCWGGISYQTVRRALKMEEKCGCFAGEF